MKMPKNAQGCGDELRSKQKNGNRSCPMGMTYPFDLIFDQIADPNLSN
jgi:hypothetical protein